MRTLLLVLTVLSAAGAAAQPRTEVVQGDTLYTLGPVDMIPAIRAPEFVPADSADAWMQPDEWVIGLVTPDGEARAYSTWHLDHHEIVLDHAGDTALAVTW